MELVLGIILLVSAVFLVIAVLFQNGKSHNLSGTIAGGAETFFGKSKGSSMDKKLNTATTVVAIIFVLLVIIVYVVQDEPETPQTDPNATVVDSGETGSDISDESASDDANESDSVDANESVSDDANESDSVDVATVGSVDSSGVVVSVDEADEGAFIGETSEANSAVEA